MTKTAIQGPDMSDFAFLFVIGVVNSDCEVKCSFWL